LSKLAILDTPVFSHMISSDWSSQSHDNE